jgi:hypothetical protein
MPIQGDGTAARAPGTRIPFTGPLQSPQVNDEIDNIITMLDAKVNRNGLLPMTELQLLSGDGVLPLHGVTRRQLDTKSDVIHTHAQADVTGLTAALAGKAGLGANTFTSDQTISKLGSADQVIINTTTPGVIGGIGRWVNYAFTSTGVFKAFSVLQANINTATNGLEDSAFYFTNLCVGVSTQVLAVARGLIVGSPAGGDMGVGTVNATNYFKSGLAIAPVTTWISWYWNGSAIVVLAASNIAGISRSALGTYVITFTTALASANFVASGDAGYTAGGSSLKVIARSPTSATVLISATASNGDPTSAAGAASVMFLGG